MQSLCHHWQTPRWPCWSKNGCDWVEHTPNSAMRLQQVHPIDPLQIPTHRPTRPLTPANLSGTFSTTNFSRLAFQVLMTHQMQTSKRPKAHSPMDSTPPICWAYWGLVVEVAEPLQLLLGLCWSRVSWSRAICKARWFGGMVMGTANSTAPGPTMAMALSKRAKSVAQGRINTKLPMRKANFRALKAQEPSTFWGVKTFTVRGWPSLACSVPLTPPPPSRRSPR